MPGPKITIRVDDRALVKLIDGTKGRGPVRVVADGVEYGLFVEMGTSRMGAQPFMSPAVEAVRGGFNKAFQGVITNKLAEQVIVKAAFDVERGAKQRAAVDTGALKNSIHVVEGEQFSVTFERTNFGRRIE